MSGHWKINYNPQPKMNHSPAKQMAGNKMAGNMTDKMNHSKMKQQFNNQHMRNDKNKSKMKIKHKLLFNHIFEKQFPRMKTCAIISFFFVVWISIF